MKKVMFLTMLATTMMMGACTSDDSWDDSWYGDDDTSAEETRRTTATELHAHTPIVYRQPGQDTGGEQKQSDPRRRNLPACGR